MQYISKKYEIIVFCNGSQYCCDQVINEIEGCSRYFAHRLYNSHVLFENPLFSVKDYEFLLKEPRTTNNTVIVDSSVATYSLMQFLGIPVTKFNPELKDDDELVRLACYLDYLAGCSNIKSIINSNVQAALVDHLYF